MGPPISPREVPLICIVHRVQQFSFAANSFLGLCLLALSCVLQNRIWTPQRQGVLHGAYRCILHIFTFSFALLRVDS